MFLRKITSFILVILLSSPLGLGNFLVFALSPNDISNKVFFLDAQDTDADGDNSNEPANGSNLGNLIDKFNSNTGSQADSNKQPIYNINSINSYPSLNFDGTDDLLNIADNLEISNNTEFPEKSYSMIIKTGNDINTFQTIYDEGTKEKGFAFQIENGHIYAGAYNTIDWSNPNQFKTIDLGIINPDTIYTIFFVYDQVNDLVKGYLDGTLISSLNNISLQTTHGACTFDTSFGCTIYDNGGTLALGSTKNDTLKLSNNSEIIGFELNPFLGNIGEISSYNHALTDSEINGLNDYLILKWGLDSIAPTISSSNIINDQILPGGNHSIKYNYSDNDGGTGIDTTSASIILEKWDGSSWINETNISQDSISTTRAVYSVFNLPFGKYRTTFNISDNVGNTSVNYITTFYIDAPELIISTGSINIGELNDNSNTFGNTITITIKTIGTGFNVKLKKNENLKLDSGEIIPYYDGSIGLGYDKNDDSNLSDYNDDIIMQEVENINTNGDLNTYTYTLKMGAIIDKLQAGGDYSGKIDFGIELNY